MFSETSTIRFTRLGTKDQPEPLSVKQLYGTASKREVRMGRPLLVTRGDEVALGCTLGLDTLQIPTLGYALFFPRTNENSPACRSFKLSTPEPLCFSSSFDLHAGGASSARLGR